MKTQKVDEKYKISTVPPDSPLGGVAASQTSLQLGAGRLGGRPYTVYTMYTLYTLYTVYTLPTLHTKSVLCRKHMFYKIGF